MLHKIKRLRFSVIIPAYNVEKYIDNAVNSVLNQTFKGYEIIIVEDCSTDNTRNVIEKYIGMPNITVIHHEDNKGLGGARNTGIDASRGEYILFLDSDDVFYDNETLKKINTTIGHTMPEIAYFGYQEIGESSDVYIPTEQTSTKEARLVKDITKYTVWSRCWRKDFLLENNIRFEEEIYYEDMAFSVKAMLLSNKTTYGSFPIVNYRIGREGSIMSTASVKRCSDLYRYMAKIMDLYTEVPEESRGQLMGFLAKEYELLPIRLNGVLDTMYEENQLSMNELTS